MNVMMDRLWPARRSPGGPPTSTSARPRRRGG
jgi:hypothetical protein